MKHKSAPMGLSIKIVTSIVLISMVAFFIGSIYISGFLIAGLIILILSIVSYLYAPAAFEVFNKKLIVYRNFGKKEFNHVINCRPITEKIPFTIRLWGNGGMFAGTGIFWNKLYGVFRVYVTHSSKSELVVVETEKQKIIISPENPQMFIEAWKSQVS